jgi:hypothetical protein
LVKDLIVDAYVIAKVLGLGESLSLVRCAGAFRSLNDLIERTMLKKTYAPYQTEITVPLMAQQSSYRIGPSASGLVDVDAPRPTEVLSGYARRNGQDYEVFVTHAKEDYDRIPSKAQAGSWSLFVYYQASFPAGILYVYPAPTDSSTSVHLTVLYALSKFTSFEEEVSLHPGYCQYFKYALAHLLAASVGLPFSDDNKMILQDCKEAIERNNIKPMPVSTTDVAGLGCAAGRGAYNIYSDQ